MNFLVVWNFMQMHNLPELALYGLSSHVSASRRGLEGCFTTHRGWSHLCPTDHPSTARSESPVPGPFVHEANSEIRMARELGNLRMFQRWTIPSWGLLLESKPGVNRDHLFWWQIKWPSANLSKGNQKYQQRLSDIFHSPPCRLGTFGFPSCTSITWVVGSGNGAFRAVGKRRKSSFFSNFAQVVFPLLIPLSHLDKSCWMHRDTVQLSPFWSIHSFYRCLLLIMYSLCALWLPRPAPGQDGCLTLPSLHSTSFHPSECL